MWVPGKLWGSEVLTPLSGTRAPLSEGSQDKSVGPARGAEGREQGQKWQGAVEGPSLFNQRAEGSGGQQTGKGGGQAAAVPPHLLPLT